MSPPMYRGNKEGGEGKEREREKFKEDSSASGHDEPWIQWFCGLKGHEMFCEVERSYIEDGFNLYGLRACVSNFSDCLDLILDRIGPDDDSDDSHLTQSACTLYGLIHARYIITAHGLDAMYNKYAAKEFGTCPLVQCAGQPVLPVSLKDEMGADTVKIYCPKCSQVYHPAPVRSSRAGTSTGVDGAAFGTTFPHLFLMTFANLVPDPLPMDSTYVPRVFGFRVHKPARQRFNAATASGNNVTTPLGGSAGAALAVAAAAAGTTSAAGATSTAADGGMATTPGGLTGHNTTPGTAAATSTAAASAAGTHASNLKSNESAMGMSQNQQLPGGVAQDNHARLGERKGWEDDAESKATTVAMDNTTSRGGTAAAAPANGTAMGASSTQAAAAAGREGAPKAQEDDDDDVLADSDDQQAARAAGAKRLKRDSSAMDAKAAAAAGALTANGSSTPTFLMEGAAKRRRRTTSVTAANNNA